MRKYFLNNVYVLTFLVACSLMLALACSSSDSGSETTTMENETSTTTSAEDSTTVTSSSTSSSSSTTTSVNTGVNTPPEAEDQSVGTDQDVSVDITLAATDADADDLIYSINDGPEYGTISGLAPGVTYNPSSGFYGTDSFTFVVSDGTDNSNIATVTIGVLASDYHLPDTNADADVTTTFGEDSDFTINPQSYTDNGDGTITDNNTGLSWQQTEDFAARDWDEAITYAENMTLGGFDDWRLPTKKELSLILDYSRVSPAINTTYFPSTNGSYYWTSTTYAFDTTNAWRVGFTMGGVSQIAKTDTLYVRCVRGGEPLVNDFTDNGNGTVTDNNTGLIWQQLQEVGLNWEEALTYVQDLTLAGHTDWRLPNPNELHAITDAAFFEPAVDISFFPAAIPPNSWANQLSYYWTSTAYSTISDPYAWTVNFRYGNVSSLTSTNSGFYVRCVRGGE